MLRSFPQGFWRRIIAPRDRELTDAGLDGEVMVARARLVLTALILVVPLAVLAEEPGQHETWVGLAAATATLVGSLVVLGAVSRGWRPRWLGFASSIYDVTIVSCVLATFLVVGTPHMAVNSRTTFEVYFLAIGATSLRYDQRICLVTGLVAALEYGLLVWFTAHHWDLNSSQFAPFEYGTFSWSSEVGRIVLLLAATVLCAGIVARTERLRVLSTHDALTALYNRAYFLERLREELLRASRYEHPLAVAIIDLDRFKHVNDEWGHTAGDVVLRSVATLIRTEMRRTDIVARYGGEEFAFIFPETTGEEATTKLERVRQYVKSSAITLPRAEHPVIINFSGGVASTTEDGHDVDELLSQADFRLLSAKNAGRARIVGVPLP